MAQNHIRWSPSSCTCVVDIMVDTVTSEQTLFALRKLCDAHKPIAIADPDFENKKAVLLAQRYQQLEDNRTTNYAQIDAYTDLQMSPAEKAGCKATVDRITQERKDEYDRLLSTASNPDANLMLCVNVHTSILEESSRYMKVYNRLQTYLNYTDEQMQTLMQNTTVSYSGVAPNRLFTVNFGNQLTNQQKTTMQTWCNNNLGVGKVTVL